MKKSSNALLVLVIALMLGLAFSQDMLPHHISLTTSADSTADLFSTTSQGTSIHFINVGQGDAILICSGGSSILIDGGDTGSGSIVVEYLTRLGIARLDAVIATHPHEEHIGGLISVLESFPVDAFYASDEPGNTETYQQLMDTLATKGLESRFPDIGDVISFQHSDATLTTLAPGPNSADVFSSRNSDSWSLVFRLDADGCSALFPGDAAFGVEQAMLQQNETALNCDILKVGSHGSNASSCQRFLQAVSPSYAVISCGETETPDPKLYEELKELQTVVLQTSTDGTVVLHLQDGELESLS